MQMGIQPEQFWALNARQFMDCWEGFQRLERADMRKRAWELCYIISPWTKRKLTPQDIWSEEPQDAPRVITSAEEFHEEAARVTGAIAQRKAWELEQARKRRRGRTGRPRS